MSCVPNTRFDHIVILSSVKGSESFSRFSCTEHELISFLYAFFFLINPVCSKPILSKLKNLRCAKLSVSYGRINLAGLCLVVTLQTSNPVNHLTQNETYFTTLASE